MDISPMIVEEALSESEPFLNSPPTFEGPPNFSGTRRNFYGTKGRLTPSSSDDKTRSVLSERKIKVAR
jgi:hypothetical protein